MVQIPNQRKLCNRLDMMTQLAPLPLTQKRMSRMSTRRRCVAVAPLSYSPPKKKRTVDDKKAAPSELPNPVELPDDLLYSILLMLPVKALLLFRCLSKRLNETIQSRCFNMDLMKAMPSRKESSVTSVIYSLPNSELGRSCVVAHKIWYQEGDLHQDTLRNKLPVDVRDKVDDIWMSTYSCDGLLCMIYERCTAFSRHPTLIIIWNPLTGCYKKLLWPKDVLDRYYRVSTFVGFGYDPTVGDYKVVVMSFDSESSLIKVRALKSDVWMTVDASAPLCNIIRSYDMLEPIEVSGDVYWIGRSRDEKSPTILKFSFAEEELTTLSFPRLDDTGRKMLVKLGHHDGSLYAYVYGFYDDEDQKLIEVWKHSKHSKNVGWEKVLIIWRGSISRDDVEAIDLLEPLGFARNGNFMIIKRDDNALFAYETEQDICVRLKMKEDIPAKESINNCHIHFLESETLIKP